MSPSGEGREKSLVFGFVAYVWLKGYPVASLLDQIDL